MPNFDYVALQGSGQEVSGREEAASEQDVSRMLAARDLFPVRIEPAAPRVAFSNWFTRGVRKRHVAVFYSQLSDLLRSGVPLLRALELLGRRTSSQPLQEVLHAVHDQVAEGTPLAEAMTLHPQAFSELAVSMVRAGEEGSFLDQVLKRVAVFTRKQQELKGQVIGALAYPVFLLTMGTIIVTGLLVFFVPKFAPIFERISARGELPWATTALLGFSGFLHDYGILLLVLIGVALFVGARYLATEAGRLRLDHLRLSAYGIGPVMQSLAISRFCRILGTLLTNGVPILRALRIAKDATGNRLLSNAIAAGSENIASGASLTEPLAASGYFPEEVVEMIAVGADSNNLEEVLIEIGDNLERDAQLRLELFVRLLEPVMLFLIAGLILFVVAALLLPIFQSSGVLT
ncbi:MAG: type II secretion system F family protein [Planctomycetota bacterium]|nr:type II secretion system F family protein [Planctomycetota bacterium]